MNYQNMSNANLVLRFNKGIYVTRGPGFLKIRSGWSMNQGSTDPWIRDQIAKALLSTILLLQKRNFVACSRDKPFYATENYVTVGSPLRTAEWFWVDFTPRINLIRFAKRRARVYMMASCHGKSFVITGPLWGESTGHRWIPLTKGQ